jgi:hypothetical protein
MYFSADPQYFDEFITNYAVPAKLVTFFQPFNVKQHLQNLGLLEELLKVREHEGYFSRTSERLIPVPKAAHQTSQQMCEWLRAQYTVILTEIMMSHDVTHVIAQVVRVRNLFILLARDGIHYRCVVDSLYKRSPLWGESHCQLLLKKYPSAQNIEQCVADVLNIDGLLQEVKW